MIRPLHDGIEGILKSRRFPGVSIQRDISGVYDPALGCRVTSNLHREEECKRRGKELIPAEDAIESNVGPVEAQLRDDNNYIEERRREGSLPSWLI